MNRIVFMFALMFSCFVLSPAQADMIGTDLKDACNSPSETQGEALCMGYVMGTLDTLRGLDKITGSTFFCEPNGITGPQLFAMTRKTLNENPKNLHYSAASLILEMMHKAFPCS